MNLFLSTRKLANSREDHLTEFFAALLDSSERFRDRYAEMVLEPFAKANGWTNYKILKVETQVGFDGTSCCPDMLLTLANQKKIICEHKLEAEETPGPLSDERLQLERYLDLSVDGVVYVRSSPKPPGSEVLAHKNYIRPVEREHFLWRDFYAALGNDESILASWLYEGFEKLGFTPPHPAIGKLYDDHGNQIESKCRNFAKLWDLTRTVARELGWDPAAGSIIQLYLNSNPRSLAEMVMLQPSRTSSQLQLRVTPKEGYYSVIENAMECARDAWTTPTEIETVTARNVDGKKSILRMTASFADILGQGKLSADQIERSLSKFVSHFLCALQPEKSGSGWV